VSAAIIFSDWLLPFAAGLVLLVLLRRKSLEGALFLANPALLPYNYSLLMGRISKAIIPLSWLALALAWKVHAGWPYALMLIGALVFETIRERRAGSMPSTRPAEM
jgi:membrane protein implicated in regulation of membrane protease activity